MPKKPFIFYLFFYGVKAKQNVLSSLKGEMDNIKRFAAYNGFPKWVVKSTIQRCNQTKEGQNEDGNEIPTISLSLPYIGNESEQVIRKTKKKLARTFKEKVKINVFFKSTKLSFFKSDFLSRN